MGSIEHWLDSIRRRLGTSRHDIRGFDVVVENTRAEIATGDVVRRLTNAIGLIDRHTPHYGRHLRRDFAKILVTRFACRGAFLPDSRTCLVELTFTVNPGVSEAQIAATILHEGMHARLHALGFSPEMTDRPRQERFCRRAEIEFGRLAPDGSPVVERAIAALELEDREVAPEIDWKLAERRVAQSDRDAR